MRWLRIVYVFGAVLIIAAPFLRPGLAYGGEASSGSSGGGSASGGDGGGGTVYVVVTIPGGPACPVAQCPGGVEAGASGGSSESGASGPPPFQCTWQPDQAFGPAPTGQSGGEWYVQICTARDGGSGYQELPVWVQQPPTTTPPALSPAQLAQQAEGEIALPSPTINTSPSRVGRSPGTVVNFPTWLWVNAGIWHPWSASASAGGLTATASAVPTSVYWDTGDGGGVDCQGPGTPYDRSIPARDQSTYCSYTWRKSSAGQPSPDGNPNDDSFTLTATITWQVSWSASNGAGGGLPALVTRSSVPMPVQQIESVNTSS